MWQVQVYEGTWQRQVVAIKVLDGAAAASQKAMREVWHRPILLISLSCTI